MTQGFAPSSDSLFVAIETLVGRLPPTSPFSFLAERGAEFFHDELFTDLFSGRGRRSESPRVVATVMVLQRQQQFGRGVFAVVGADHDVVEPQSLVMRDPFEDKGSFVAHH